MEDRFYYRELECYEKAGEVLLRVIGKNEGGANKDLARFADQINSLCDKWDI